MQGRRDPEGEAGGAHEDQGPDHLLPGTHDSYGEEGALPVILLVIFHQSQRESRGVFD